MYSDSSLSGWIAYQCTHHEDWAGYDGKLGKSYQEVRKSDNIKKTILIYFHKGDTFMLENMASPIVDYQYSIYKWCFFSHREGLSLDITALAKEVYSILRAPANPAPRTPEREKKRKPQFFINSTNNKAKSVTLHIQGLDSTVSLLTYLQSDLYFISFTLAFSCCVQATKRLMWRGSSESQRSDQLHFSNGLKEVYSPHPFRPPHRGKEKAFNIILFWFVPDKVCQIQPGEKSGAFCLNFCIFCQSLATAIASTKVLSAQQVVKNEAGEEVNIIQIEFLRIPTELLKYFISLPSGLCPSELLWRSGATKRRHPRLPPRGRGEPREGGWQSNFPHCS